MNDYEGRPLLTMPFPKPLKEMTDEELAQIFTSKHNYNILIPTLIEANLRQKKHFRTYQTSSIS